MTKGWMVRAGLGGRLAEEFREQGCVVIGWNEIGDLTSTQVTKR
ncbi:MAG: hypothetical protein V7731_12920 [Amphritea sp.]